MGAKFALLVLCATTVAACGDGAGPAIDDVRIGQPTGPNTAMYFTATGDGEADRLVGAETARAASVEMHETTIDDDGTMGMRAIEGIDLAADGTLVFEPGGFHLMLVDADRMEVGETIEVTLVWENAGGMTVEAEVVDPGDTMSDDS